MKAHRYRTLLALLLATTATTSLAATTGLQRDAVFATMPAYARNRELLQRLASPFAARRTRDALRDPARMFAASPLDPSRQHFALYVPPTPAADGRYALLVFVPPWNDARIPAQWVPALDATHTIMVTAADPDSDVDGKSYRDHLNPDSRRVVRGFLEPSLRDAAPEQPFQFERLGYFIADRHDHAHAHPVFNRAVSLRDAWLQKQGGASVTCGCGTITPRCRRTTRGARTITT